MKINVKEGNYAKLGVQQQAGQVTFTFCGEKEDICFVVLVRKSDMNRVRVEVPESFVWALCGQSQLWTWM